MAKDGQAEDHILLHEQEEGWVEEHILPSIPASSKILSVGTFHQIIMDKLK